MTFTLDQFTGCLLGLATGDAIGAPAEGGLLEQLVWRIIGRTADGCHRWTDDTQMAVDLAESLLEEEGANPDAIARRFAASYRWSRGYGPGTAKVLRRIRRGEPWQSASVAVHAQGSHGNGAAMRAPVVALFFAGHPEQVISAARTTARITHAHPSGIDGAILMALAAHALLLGQPLEQVLENLRAHTVTAEIASGLATAADWIKSRSLPPARELATRLGNGSSAATSCPTALFIALSHLERSFESMMELVLGCGGDVDTIGSMSGALWGTANGARRLPSLRLEAREHLVSLAGRLFRRQN